MTIEVRQILIRSTVGDAPAPAAAAPPTPEWIEQLRQQLLAQCRALLERERELARDR